MLQQPDLEPSRLLGSVQLEVRNASYKFLDYDLGFDSQNFAFDECAAVSSPTCAGLCRLGL